MAKLTKTQFEDLFREEVLPYVIDRYEQDGIPDKPARREAWNDTVDAYIRDRMLPEAAGNWSHPRWLETYRPRGVHHATKKNEIRYVYRGSVERGTGRGYRWHDGYSADSPTGGVQYPWMTKREAQSDAKAQGARAVFVRTKKSPAQLDREITEALGGKAHATAKRGINPGDTRGRKFVPYKEHADSLWVPLTKFREMVVDGKVTSDPADGYGRYGKLDGGRKMVSNVNVETWRVGAEPGDDRGIPTWANYVAWYWKRKRSAHATRKRSQKEVSYRGYTYNLRSAYDRGYYDALTGVRAQEQSADYATGYTAGQSAPYLRR
jgi:hypothetical protein